jgi:excisionase family DNA binding protein
VSEAERAVLTAKEAAAYLGMSVSWVEHSDLPRVRLGRAVRYRRQDLDAYLAARLTHGSAA